MYPVKFECVDDSEELVFHVEMFDEAAASVEIKTLVTVSTWDEISALVREALIKMELEG